MEKDDLKLEIERKKLTELYELKGSFSDPEVLAQSEKLDKLILKQFEKMVS